MVRILSVVTFFWSTLYIVICFQLQGFTWCALRLRIEEKIDGEGQPFSIESSILYTLITQLFGIVFSLLVHIFFKKCLRILIPIYRLYENSSSKILLLCFIIDFASIVCGSITKTIKHLKIVIEEYIPDHSLAKRYFKDEYFEYN